MNGMERWRGKVALVTGASAGIGAATAKALASAGMKVVLAARRLERLQALSSALTAQGGACLPLAVDLNETGAIARMFAEIRNHWGGVDVLINNAGLGRRLNIVAAEPDSLQAMLDVNIRAATWCIREALLDMQGKPDAAIVNISSLAGHRILPGRGATFYAATKHALRALTDGLRQELVAEGSPVKIGMISPGLVESEFHEKAQQGKPEDPAYYPFKPLTSEDLAETVLFMLSRPRHVQINDILLRSVHQPG